jgi:hypothetical protein
MPKLPSEIFNIVNLVANIILSIHYKKYLWALVKLPNKCCAGSVFSDLKRLHEKNHEFGVFLIPVIVKRKLDAQRG